MICGLMEVCEPLCQISWSVVAHRVGQVTKSILAVNLFPQEYRVLFLVLTTHSSTKVAVKMEMVKKNDESDIRDVWRFSCLPLK